MNGLQYLMGAVYRTRCDFASIEGFEKLLAPRFADLRFDHESVREALLATILEFEWEADWVGPDEALHFVVAQDLRRILSTLDTHRMHPPEERLEQLRGEFESALRALELRFDRPRIYVVDEFPKPYHTMDWVAMSPDAADQQHYGIPVGNYFKRSELVPYRSDFLLGHEMIHQIVGEVNPHLLGRGLEEGIAVVLGELYVGGHVIGDELAKRYAVYHWFDRRLPQGNRLYAEYARMASAIYRRCGLDGILALVQGGRDVIKSAEQAMLAGTPLPDLPKGNWDENYTSLLEEVLSSTISELTVGPLAKYVAPYATVGATFDEISARARVRIQDVATAVEELQHKAVVVMTNDDRIDYSDVQLLSPTHALRYDV